jgi:GDP-D-mannose dehydratase
MNEVALITTTGEGRRVSRRTSSSKRRSSSFTTERLDHLYNDPRDKDTRFRLHYGDTADSTNLVCILQEVAPARTTRITTGSTRNFEAHKYNETI